ncbi:MAG: hypothetical protein Q9M89_00590 [Persephonella sp.]|nr:hypothetical protein [Persephonella sp.]
MVARKHIFDGIQRPLPLLGERIEKGEKHSPLSTEKLWHFRPSVKEGEKVKRHSTGYR